MKPQLQAQTSDYILNDPTGNCRYEQQDFPANRSYSSPITGHLGSSELSCAYKCPKDTATASCEPQFSAGFVGPHPQVWRIFIPALSGKMKIQEPLGENGFPMPNSSSVIVYLRRWSRWWATQQTVFARHNSRWDFIGWVSPETTARSLVLPTAGTASINKWTRLFSGIAIQFALCFISWKNGQI